MKLVIFVFSLFFIIFVLGCNDGESQNSQNSEVELQASAVFYSEDVVLENNFSSGVESWSAFYQGALSIALSSEVYKSTPNSLKVFNRANNYDGAYINISDLITADKTYAIRGYIKTDNSNKDTYSLAVKIGDSTYRQLNRVLVGNEWTKFRVFVRFTQNEIDSGIKIYLNSDNNKDDYYLDDLQITSSNYNPSDGNSTKILKINGNTIKNSSNEIVNLKGINLIAYSDEDESTTDLSAEEFINYSYYNYDKIDFFTLKNMGFNSIRLSLWYRTFEDESNPNNYKESGFEWLDFVIGWAKEAGIGVVLDMHAPQGGGFQGPSNVTEFWSNETYQTRFKNLWREIAQRYKNEPTIYAYDILNEPCANTQTQYLTLLKDTIGLIRQIDANHIINAEVDFSANQYEPFELVGQENILYDFHFYDPWDDYTNSDDAVYKEDVSQEEVKDYFDSLANFYTSRNLPFQVSEFGQKYENFNEKNAIDWVGDVIDMINASSGNYHYFSFKGNEFGFYDGSNNFSQDSQINNLLRDLFISKQL